MVLFGDVVTQHRGEEGWERVAIVRYPTARSFYDMQLDPVFVTRHEHKAAGMERTIIMPCRPLGPLFGATTAPTQEMLVDLVSELSRQGVTPAGADLAFLGMLVGDGRSWAKVRLTPAAGEDPTLCSWRRSRPRP